MALASTGRGYWAPNLVRHSFGMAGANMAMVCHTPPSRLVTIGQCHPSAATTVHVDEMVQAPGIDTVVIATQVGTHVDLRRRALIA